MKLLKQLTPALLCAFLLQCGGASTAGGDPFDPPMPPDPTIAGPGKLIVRRAEDVNNDLKKIAIDQMEETLAYYGTCPEKSNADSGDFSEDDVVFESPMSAPSSDAEGSDIDYTATNLQEKDVDESDVVKTDGHYIYVATSNGVDVFKSWPLVDFKKLTTFELNSTSYAMAPDMYLLDDLLVLIYGIGNKTELYVVDVKNPEAPTLITKKEFAASKGDSRIVDGVLHLAFSGNFKVPSVDTTGVSSVYTTACDKGTESAREQLQSRISDARKSYAATINQRSLNDWLPSLGGDDPSAMATSYYSDGTSSGYLTGLYSYDLHDLRTEQLSLIRGYSYALYGSTESVFLYSQGDTVTLHRFAISEGEVAEGRHKYITTGVVEGTLHNSFSLGEYEGYLRLATTIDFNGSNNITILDTKKEGLPVVGKMEGIAPGESIYSARFIGSRGYLVTFKKIDPFFVLDLADPTHPQIKGELKMPGFSSYLHVLDDDHIIGLGKDAEDTGSFAWFQGLKLAIFDVSDEALPAILDEEIIGARGTESEALDDHHAFTFDRESGILALPLKLTTGGKGFSDYGKFDYNGVHLYSLSTAGIESIAEIKIPNPNSWSGPRRTMMIGDEEAQGLIVLDHTKIYLFDMNNDYQLMAEEDLSEVDWWYGYDEVMM